MSASSAGSAATYLVGLLLVAVTAVMSYLFYFSPTFADISELRQQAISQRDFNETFAAQVTRLRQDFEQIDAFEAQLHEIQWDLPPIENAPEMFRTIDSIVTAQPRITVVRYELGLASEVFNQISLADAYAARGEVSYVEGLEFTGLYMVPIRLELVGPLWQVLIIVDDLQQGPHPFILIQELVWNAVEPEEASGARPATVLGDVEASISGMFFVLVQEGTDPRILPGEFGEYPLWSRSTDNATNEGAGANGTEPPSDI